MIIAPANPSILFPPPLFVSSGGGGGGGNTTQTLLQYLLSLAPGNGFLGGQYDDQFNGPGKSLDLWTILQSFGGPASGIPSSGQTPANISILNNISSSSSNNTNKQVAIMGVNINTNGTAGTSVQASEGITNAQGHMNRWWHRTCSVRTSFTFWLKPMGHWADRLAKCDSTRNSRIYKSHVWRRRHCFQSYRWLWSTVQSSLRIVEACHLQNHA